MLRSILRSTSGPLQFGIGLACRRLTVWEGMDQASFKMRADTFAFFFLDVSFVCVPSLDPQYNQKVVSNVTLKDYNIQVADIYAHMVL